MSERRIIPAASGVGFPLKRGQQLRIIDHEGGQTGDLTAFSPDGRERLSSGRTFDYNNKIHVSTGDALWSDHSSPMLTIVADDVGRHDMLYTPCSAEMYRIQYQCQTYHANCLDNLAAALREMGIEPGAAINTLNFFMCVEVAANGALIVSPPRTYAGASMVLRAEMDLAVALSSCPATTCNGGAPPRSLAFELSGG